MTITFDIERGEAGHLLRYAERENLGNLAEQLQQAIENEDWARYDLLEEGKIL